VKWNESIEQAIKTLGELVYNYSKGSGVKDSNLKKLN
jgi:hypothetical protein